MRGALDRYLPVSDDKISLEYKLKRWIEGSWLRSGRGALLLERDVFAASSWQQIRPRRERQRAAKRWWTNWGSAPGGVMDRYLTVDQNYYLPDDILYKTDRMSMAHSLEVRPPFLDHRIVEFAASLPQRLEDPRVAAEVRAAGADAREAAGDGAEPEEDGLRHPDARLVPGRAAGIC